MNYKNIDKIILFGGSQILAAFAPLAKEAYPNTVVFSAKRHLEEKIAGKTLKETLEENEIPHHACDDINTSEALRKEVTEQSLGLSFGAAWTFEKDIVNLFSKGNLLDFMGIDLPRYRGGAHYTWQILHQNTVGCANLQVILGGEETFHKGPVIKREKYLIKNCKTPQDYFDSIIKEEIEFLKAFLEEAKIGKPFKEHKLDEETSSHYPFLYTKTSGLIDWNWTGEEIARFIDAFDNPYPGASTFIGKKRAHLKDCSLLPAQEVYHPFTSGIITRKNEQGVFVATKGALLLIKCARDEQGKDLLRKLQPGMRLHTPSTELDKARMTSIEYDAKGPKEGTR